MLEVTDLSKRFRRRRGEPDTLAVDRASFTLDAGRTLAIVGESGAGKSTLGRMILRLIEPDDGSVVLDGIDVRALRPAALRELRRKMQIVLQDPFSSLDPRYTIGRSLAEPLRLHFGLNRVDRETKAQELLELVGLGFSHLHRLPNELSGGQLQRVAIARALAVEPRLIVCDEPVAALDVSIRAQILNLLLDIQDRMSVSYLFITHDLATVRVIADEIVVMRQGRIVEHGATGVVLANPTQRYTRELLASVPTLRLDDRTNMPS